MRKKTQFLFRISSFALTLLMLVNMLVVSPLTVNATSSNEAGGNYFVQKRSYEIAVVFDNSGSMYQNEGWCRAKYAMEIFASMLNYDDGDKLKIFPMWESTTDGSTPSSGGSYAAIEINSKEDIDKISNLYTVHPSNTPFAPITEAYDYLKTSSADEKWLIVLTDGAFNEEARGQKASIDLQNRVSALASDSIKVQYLGFGNATELVAEESRGFFSKNSSDTSLKDDLIDICNAIFQRSVLPENRLNEKTLTLDLSMKKLIVFAQGSNAKIMSLTDANGEEVKITLDSGQRKYSEIRAKGYADAPIDDSLAGQVITFGACAKGTYTLNYSDADAIQIFYEPDVDIKVTLTNSDGEVIDPSEGEISAGEYKVSSAIVDSVTGEDVTNAELMGEDVKLTTYVKTSSESEFTEYENGSTISLEPDSSTEVIVEGTYLKDYTLSTKDDPDAFPLPIIVFEPKVDLAVKADVQQSQAWYQLKDHAEWKPVRVTLSIDGMPLTEEQMAQTVFEVTIPGDLAYWYEALPGESAYNVYIGHDESGNYVEPDTGRYNLKASATYTGEYGVESSAEDSAGFEIQWYSIIWRWLLWLVILGIILFITFLIMSQKVLPRQLAPEKVAFFLKGKNVGGGDVTYDRKGKSLMIKSIPVPSQMDAECKASFKLYAVDRRWTPSKRRRFGISDISNTSLGVTKVRIDSSSFEKKGSKFVLKGAADDPIREETQNPIIKIETSKSYIECRFTQL